MVTLWDGYVSILQGGETDLQKKLKAIHLVLNLKAGNSYPIWPDPKIPTLT